MNHRLLNKYLFLTALHIDRTDLARPESLDHVFTRWDLFRISGIDQRGYSLADAALAADPHRCGRNHDIRVLDRLHRQSVARLGSLGLQRASGQPLGADLSAVLSYVAAGGTGRNRSGRLDPVPKVRGGTATLQMI